MNIDLNIEIKVDAARVIWSITGLITWGPLGKGKITYAKTTF